MNFMNLSDDCIQAMKAADQAEAAIEVARKNAERLREVANQMVHRYEVLDPYIKSEREETAEILHLMDECLRDPNAEVVANRKITMSTILGGWGERNHKDTAEKLLRAKKGSLEERRKYELFLAYIRKFKKNNE